MSIKELIKSPTAKVALLVLFGVGCLLMVILVPLSLSGVEYYEYGLKMRKTTGKVITTQVYDNGRYLVGPTSTFLTYQADAHHVQFDDLSVFSSGLSNSSIGVHFKVDVDFTYLLIKDEIGQLHQELASSYKTVIESRAKDAIKNEAIFVSFTEYFQDRKKVEQMFRDAVQARWNAKPSLHCILDQFHLGRIQIPESVAEKQLEGQVQNERNDKEKYDQQAQVERELTDVEVNSILLEKDKVLRTAQAEAALLRARAEAESERLKAEAHVTGARILFDTTGITTQEHVTAFTYIRTLANREDLDLDVSYLSSDNVLRTKVA